MSKNRNVRVRFAPSPTGYLHVGGLRTALYNYLFARSMGGTMIIRIEDTDRTRLVEDAQDNLIKSLAWSGIEFDEGPGIGGEHGPYVQSERFDLYREHSEILIENGSAYYAFDTPEEIDAMRDRQKKAGLAPKYDRSTMRNGYTLGEAKTKELLDAGEKHVVRLKVPFSEDIKFKDVIRGDVTVKGKDVDDQVLLKSDGFPTYHLANVVDDHAMEISHVIRGEEWLPSTPKHVLLYKAFGWEQPAWAHLPLLLNSNKSKLSKRHGDVSVEDFNKNGYIAHALTNFVALLGWNPSGSEEIHSMDDLIAGFKLEKVNKGGAIFDRPKLEWMNSIYLRKLPVSDIYKDLKPLLDDAGHSDLEQNYVESVIDLLKERIHFTHDLVEFGSYMWERPSDDQFDEKYIKKQWKENTPELIIPLINKFKDLDNWSKDAMHKIVVDYLEEKELGFGKVMHPLRLMATGKPVGADLLTTLQILGKEESMARFDNFLERAKNGNL